MDIQTTRYQERRPTRITGGLLVAASLLFGVVSTVEAEISVNIGLNLGAYPNLALIPGYPVYYDPQADANYFFYDDMYWVYRNDNWYSSGWYNGPWQSVSSYAVPLYMLRVPVAYYRQPPSYFRGWGGDAPPHWGEHYGNGWEQRRAGWDHWNHGSNAAPAPLPAYQRQYPKDRYPDAAAQRTIQSENHRSQPQPVAFRQNSGQPHSSVAQRPTTAPAQQEPAQHSQGQPQAEAQHAQAQRQHAQPPVERAQAQAEHVQPHAQQPAQHSQGQPQPQTQHAQPQTQHAQPQVEQKGGEERAGHDH